jgi:hypothetical protein
MLENFISNLEKDKKLMFMKDMEKYIHLLEDGSLKQEILLNFQKILLVFIK